MKFDINNYPREHYMICQTREESDAFREYLESIGRTWRSGTLYSQKDFWDMCIQEGEESIGYAFHEGLWGTPQSIHRSRRIYYSDFDWEETPKVDSFDMSFDEMFNCRK